MTFTMQVKDEMSKIEPNSIDALTELSAFIRFDGTISKDEILLTMENASVARRIYKLLKTLFNVKPNMMVRVQKRFRVKQHKNFKINANFKSGKPAEMVCMGEDTTSSINYEPKVDVMMLELNRWLQDVQ